MDEIDGSIQNNPLETTCTTRCKWVLNELHKVHIVYEELHIVYSSSFDSIPNST